MKDAIRKLKAGYRKWVPYPARAFTWYVRNLFGYIFSDRVPVQWDFDYEKYWRERMKEEGGDEIAYPELAEICLATIPEGSRVLDIGCGSGELIKKLTARKKVICVGIDVSRNAIEIAKKRGIEAHVLDVAKEDISRLGNFDVVTLFELLEHIPNPERLLLEIKRYWPQATVIASVPNTGYLGARLRLLFGRFPRQWIVHPSEHIRFWTLRDFQLMTKGLGYEILRVIPIRGVQALAKSWPALFAEDLVFVLRSVKEHNLEDEKRRK